LKNTKVGTVAALNFGSLAAPTADIAQTDLYRSMRAEAAKLESASSHIDWTRLLTLSQQVLQDYGQDLLAAAYWVHARHRTDGIEALGTGLNALCDLLENAWECFSPPVARSRARAGAVQWVVDHSAHALQRTSTRPSDTVLDQLDSAIARLTTVAQRRFAERAPAFSGLRQGVASCRALVSPTPSPGPPSPLSPHATPAPAVVTSAPPVPAWPPEPTPAEPLSRRPGTGADDAALSLPDLGQKLCRHALALRQANAEDPAAYRLLRVGAWLHIDGPPPSLAGITRVLPLPHPARALLDQYLQQGDWLRLLTACEDALLHNRLCFDLQRYAAVALTQLGAPYIACLTAVQDEVRGFIRRVPTVFELSAADKSPLADQKTQQWLRSLLPPSGVDPHLDRRTPAVASGKVLPPCIASIPDGHRRTLHQLTQAETANGEGHVAVALVLYDRLHRVLQRRRLFGWDEALSMRFLQGYWQALACVSGRGQRKKLVFTQIAQLRPDLAKTLV
jgi:type VI secretion system protein VasJ